ncbi:MAG: DinB family protein [Pyrinomonadaceae bacterium]|nr:DinB family protein [Pyrinomonadaceae bacterium]
MNDELAWTLRTARRQTLALITDVPDDRMCLQSSEAEQHPAWILGHILLSDVYLLSLLGVRSLSEDFPLLLRAHGPGAVPEPFVDNYYSKSTLVDRLEDTGLARREAIQSLSASDLARPLPDEILVKAQPTIGHHLHSLVFHEGYHCGQLSAWRKSHRIASGKWMFGPLALDAA